MRFPKCTSTKVIVARVFFIFLLKSDPSLALAKKAVKPLEPKRPSHYLVIAKGQKFAEYFETTEVNAKAKTIEVVQKWTQLGPPAADFTIQMISGKGKALKPAWLFMSYKDKKENKEFQLNIALEKRKSREYLTVKMEKQLPLHEVSTGEFALPANPFFMPLLPFYLARLESGFYTATGILPNLEQARFDTKNFRIRKLDEEKTFGKAKCTRSVIEFDGFEGDIWVSKDGRICDYQIPEMKMTYLPAPEEEGKPASKH